LKKYFLLFLDVKHFHLQILILDSKETISEFLPFFDWTHLRFIHLSRRIRRNTKTLHKMCRTIVSIRTQNLSSLSFLLIYPKALHLTPLQNPSESFSRPANYLIGRPFIRRAPLFYHVQITAHGNVYIIQTTHASSWICLALRA